MVYVVVAVIVDLKFKVLIGGIAESELGKGSNNQNGNLRWHLP